MASAKSLSLRCCLAAGGCRLTGVDQRHTVRHAARVQFLRRLVLRAGNPSSPGGPMRRVLPWVICVTWWVSACSSTAVPTSPTLLEPPAQQPTNRPPRAYRQANWRTPTMFTSIAASDQISSQVTNADPLCDPGWPYHCQFFRLDAPGTGQFTITMRWSPSRDRYPLDIDVTDPEGWTWDCTVGPGEQRRVTLEVHPGTYWVSVWSSGVEEVPFTLTTSFAPK